MKKFILITLSAIFLSSLLVGCQLNEKAANESEWTSISISKTKGVDAITFDDQETMNTLQSIFASAVKVAGIADMTDPEFYLKVVDDKENQKRMHLWIGEKGQKSTIMNTEDTHTIYTVSEEQTEKLIELVESQFH